MRNKTTAICFYSCLSVVPWPIHSHYPISKWSNIQVDQYPSHYHYHHHHFSHYQDYHHHLPATNRINFFTNSQPEVESPEVQEEVTEAEEIEAEKDEAEEEDEDEDEDDDEDDEDEEEAVDPFDELKEECAKTDTCAPHVHHFHECVERVTAEMEEPDYAHKAYKEDCVEEFFHLQHCVNDCAAPRLFYKLK